MVIDPDKVKLVWVANSYDGQIHWGHAWYGKQYCYVLGDLGLDKSDEEYGTYALYALEGQYLLNELARRQMFSDLVGLGHFMTPLIPKHKTVFSGNPMDYYNELKQTIPETNIKDLKYLGSYRAYERDED